MERRKFIQLSAGIIPLLQAHMAMAQMGSAASQKPAKAYLIEELRLLTQSPLEEVKDFYCNIIGFTLKTINDKNLVIQAGKTTIRFEKIDKGQDRPFYHFAFNIPENKIEQAFEWQRKKTPIVHPNPSGPKDEITHFPHWNAHSIFFLDPAGNLVEYIARHTLSNASSGDFTLKDIQYASEIGFIVDDVKDSGAQLMNGLSIQQYHDPTQGFWPIGNEYGLLLMINKGREWRGLPGQKNITGIFKTSITINTGSTTKFELDGYPYEILKINS